MAGLGQGESLSVGPRLPPASLATGLLRPIERHQANEASGRQRLYLSEQQRQRKPGPRHRHGPGFDAAVPVEALFEWEGMNDIIHMILSRLGHQSGDLELPGQRFKWVDLAPDLFAGAEFVESAVPRGRGLGGCR